MCRVCGLTLEEEKVLMINNKKPNIVIDEEVVRGMISEFKDYVMNRNISECKSFIHKFVNKIMVYRDHIEVEYKFNLKFIDDSSDYLQKKKISRKSILEIYKERYNINDLSDYLHKRVMETHPQQPRV